MIFSEQPLSAEKVKNIDLIDYLLQLGYKPVKVAGKSYWYLSPLRKENHPSFKVNKSMNRWYDFGEGKGGNIIDFGILYHRCSVAEFLQKMNMSFGFRPQLFKVDQHEENSKKIQVIQDKAISSLMLIRYLHKRRIPLDIANKYCREIDFELYGKRYYALGFKNESGGYELRNEKFKGSSSPKDMTLLKNDAKDLTVFEGFFNFLSYVSIHQKQAPSASDFLILNSASFFEKSLPLMQTYEQKHLYMDRDTTGQMCIQKAQAIDDQSFIDDSTLYKNFNDLNEWLMHNSQFQKQELRIRM